MQCCIRWGRGGGQRPLFCTGRHVCFTCGELALQWACRAVGGELSLLRPESTSWATPQLPGCFCCVPPPMLPLPEPSALL